MWSKWKTWWMTSVLPRHGVKQRCIVDAALFARSTTASSERIARASQRVASLQLLLYPEQADSACKCMKRVSRGFDLEPTLA
jgi:hypothetical protein